MTTQNVLRTHSLEHTINGKFVFCKELKKGFIKRDLSTLGLTDYSFENVSNTIEGLTLVELEATGLNVVIFVNGEEKISHRTNLEIVKLISEMDSPTVEMIQSFQVDKRLSRNYFDEAVITTIIDGLAVISVDDIIFIDPINYSVLQGPIIWSSWLNNGGNTLSDGLLTTANWAARSNNDTDNINRGVTFNLNTLTTLGGFAIYGYKATFVVNIEYKDSSGNWVPDRSNVRLDSLEQRSDGGMILNTSGNNTSTTWRWFIIVNIPGTNYYLYETRLF